MLAIIVTEILIWGVAVDKTSNNRMTLGEKLKWLQEIADVKSQTEFADLIGINTQTLRRIGKVGKATNHVLERIADAFEGLDVDILRDDSRPLPGTTSLREIHTSQTFKRGKSIYEGTKLKDYLGKHGIRQADLAERLGTSRVQVHYYLKSERFSAHTKKSIVEALNVSEDELFGPSLSRQYNTSISPQITIVNLPLLLPSDRHQTPEQLLEWQNVHSSATNSDRTFPVIANYVGKTSEELKSALALKVTDQDGMNPVLRHDAVVLAFQVPDDQWEKITDGSVAMLVDNQLRIRQVYRNDLRTSGSLEVGGADLGRGGVITLRRSDVQAILKITHILLSPA